MAKELQKHGILALAELVDFACTSSEHDDSGMLSSSEPFREKVQKTIETHGFECIESRRHSIAFFGEDPRRFVAILFDLFCRYPMPGVCGFNLNLRVVAHSGYVYFFCDEQGKKIGLSRSSVPTAYHLSESRMRAPDIVVSDALLSGIQPYLEEMHFTYCRETNADAIRAFESMGGASAAYRISSPPFSEREIPLSNRYRKKREEVLRLAKKIPELADLFPPVPIGESLVTVCLEKEWKHETLPQPPSSNWERLELCKDCSWLKERDLTEKITAEELLSRFNKGFIVGLPGSGKTTFLRHVLYTILRDDPEAVILLIDCRYVVNEITRTSEDAIQESLRILTASFLFPGTTFEQLTPSEARELDATVCSVLAAWQHGQLIILIDALDEAPSGALRENILALSRILMADLSSPEAPDQAHEKNNICFLTSRLAEFPQRIFSREPVFHVTPLTSDAMRTMAASFFGKDSEALDRFDKQIGQEPVIQKIGGTPLITLLLLVCFERTGTFDLRYYAFDLILKFLLKRVWGKIKQEHFRKPGHDLRQFLAEASSPRFFEDNPEIRLRYDALCSLAYDALYHPATGRIVRLIPRKTIFEHCRTWLLSNEISESDRSNSLVRQAINQQVNTWIEHFQAEHILIRKNFETYTFVHTTVMEFLAARHFLSLLEKEPLSLASIVDSPDKEELETLPLAAGSHYETGFVILRHLRPLFKNRESDSTLPFRCLSEIEAAECKALEGLSTDRVFQPEQERIERGSEARDWVYRSLAAMVETMSHTELEERISRFAGLIPLSRPRFIEHYLSPDWGKQGDRTAREQFLKIILNEEIVRELLQRPTETILGEETVLTLDKAGSPLDKNFAYYQGRISSALRGFFGSPNLRHSAPVTACAFSPDGWHVLSASSDQTLKLWEAATGRELWTRKGHPESVIACAFSPDGGLIASGSCDRTLKLWDAALGKEIRTIGGHKDWVRSVAFSPDGTLIVSGSDDCTVRIWDVSTGKEVKTLEGHQGWVRTCCFSPDGLLIASGSSDQTVRIWEAATAKELMTLEGHGSTVSACAFSPDGKLIISGSSDRTLKLWQVDTGRERKTLEGHRNGVNGCAFSPDGTLIVSGSSDHTLKLWNATTAEEIKTLNGHTSMVRSCAFSPDGMLIVSGSSDHTLKLWEVAAGRELIPFDSHAGWVHSCDVSADGNLLVSGSSDHSLKLWEIPTGRKRFPLKGHMNTVHVCGFSPDGKYIVSGSADRTAKIWETGSGRELRTLKGHKDWVKACDFSPDNRLIATGSSDRTVRIWEMANGHEARVLEGHTDWVGACAFSPDGRYIVSGSSDRTLRIWERESGHEVRILEGHKGGIRSCRFSPDGKRIASASSDQTVRVWPAAGGTELLILQGHNDGVNA
ncbi:MAG TPA: hypothetical protein PKL48_08695, partial [Thermodesulfobacteriota bacterium]|nr:hypothetical protein [Thermodesulfobacteriota bacterium]